MASTAQNFWASHVMYAKGMYYFIFVESDSIYKTGKGLSFALFVATSKSSTGSFKVKEKSLIEGDGVGNIYPMSFQDPKTSMYYLF